MEDNVTKYASLMDYNDNSPLQKLAIEKYDGDMDIIIIIIIIKALFIDGNHFILQ